VRPGWVDNCPAADAQCVALVNMVIALDGSADPDVFEDIKSFAVALVDKFFVNEETGARIAVVLFAETAELVLDFSNDAASVKNFILNIPSAGRSFNSPRCYSCAIETAKAAAVSDGDRFGGGQSRTNASRRLVILGAGSATVDAVGLLTATNLVCLGFMPMYTYGIVTGFGTQLDGNTLNSLNCGLPTGGLGGFDNPAADVAAGLERICGEAAPSRRCGSNCRGICGCAAKCDCPSTCGGDDACGGQGGGYCTDGLNGNACICEDPADAPPPTDCARTFDRCLVGAETFPGSGNCTDSPVDCGSPPSDPCLGSWTCGSAAGCRLVPPSCADQFPDMGSCQYAVCTPDVGCELKDTAVCIRASDSSSGGGASDSSGSPDSAPGSDSDDKKDTPWDWNQVDSKGRSAGTATRATWLGAMGAVLATLAWL